MTEPTRQGRPPVLQRKVFDYIVSKGSPVCVKELCEALERDIETIRDLLRVMLDRKLLAATGIGSDGRTMFYVVLGAFYGDWAKHSRQEIEKIRDNVTYALNHAHQDGLDAAVRKRAALRALRDLVAHVAVRDLARETKEVTDVSY